MDQVRELAWDYAAGQVFVEELPMAAAHALGRGIDSPALRELAGLCGRPDPMRTSNRDLRLDH